MVHRRCNEAEPCDYSSVKGCLNYLPNGYAIWELIQADLDKRFRDRGETYTFQRWFSENLFEKESGSDEGFAPEVAWVTHGGMERLQERLCIRPTSETLFCDLWSKTVQSYRDLPKVWIQNPTWEKTTRPFLRSEFYVGIASIRNFVRGEEQRSNPEVLKGDRGLLQRDACNSHLGFVEEKQSNEKFAGASGYLHNRSINARW